MRLQLHHARQPTPDVHASVEDHRVVVALDRGEVHTWDASGRWLGGVADGRQWHRSYDHRFQSAQPGTRMQRVEDPLAITGILARVQHDAERLLQDLASASLTVKSDNPAPLQQLVAVLSRAAARDAGAFVADGERFRALYGGAIAVLPEDLRRALYLQTSIGCPWNSCRFCTLYAGRSFRVRTPQEFGQHVRDIVAWHGGAMALRRSIFLGDADMLAGGAAHLLMQWAEMAKHVCVAEAKCYCALPHVQAVDGFATAGAVLRTTSAELAALARLGLRRVYVGVETGCKLLHKRMQRRDPLVMIGKAVEQLHGADIGLGLTVLVGVGGARWQQAHLEQTVALLADLGLGGKDQVSLSPMVIDPASAYAAWAQAERILPLTDLELQAQVELFRSALAARWPAGGGPRLAPYRVDEPPW